jgi:uncharacterized membrane protein YqjE
MSLGLVRSVQDLLTNALGIARTRLDLLSVEMQELLARLVLVMVGAVAALMLGTLALGFGAFALVMATPPEQRVWTAAALAGAFLAAAALVAWLVRRETRGRPFAASLAELERDVAALETRE